MAISKIINEGIGNLTANMSFDNGSGIDFSASEGSNASSSVLDDYEEGTWTPTASTNITSLTNEEGFYTKIGNLVTVLFYATIDPTSTTSSMVLGGLPFPVADNLTSSNVEGTGVVFEDNSIFMSWAQGTTSEIAIEIDRPIEGTASSSVKNYRGTLTYFTA